jgi:hypothetical protein
MKTMERSIAKVFLGLLFTVFTIGSSAQEAEAKTATKVEFSTGADVVSSYVFRGVKYSDISIQPSVEMSAGAFTLGAWGSSGFDGFLEMDLFASVALGGLSVGLTDYYYPGGSYFDTSIETGAHAFEANLSYEIKGLSLAANYIFNEAGYAASAGEDMYFELGYDFGKFGLAVGGGNGWHTTDGEFQVCNIAISTSKEIKVSDTFSIPVGGSIFLNPNTEQFYIVVTASF